MRIFVAILIITISFGLNSAIAQHTFDMKYTSNSYFSGPLRGLFRLTPSKILVNSTYCFDLVFATLDNDGNTTKAFIAPIFTFSSPCFWYDSVSTIITALVSGENPRSLQLIHIDTNMKAIKYGSLDSRETGVPDEYNDVLGPCCIELRDSTVLAAAIYYASKANKYMTCALRFSKKGEFLGKSMFETGANPIVPLFQKVSGEILWYSGKYFNRSASTAAVLESDINNLQNLKLIVEDFPPIYTTEINEQKSIIQTSDGGLAVIHIPVSNYSTTVVSKYDSTLHKQWSVTVPNYSTSFLKVIEGENGNLYAITNVQAVPHWSCGIDIGISRITSAGRYISTAYYGNGHCIQESETALVDSDGGILISGLSDGWVFTDCDTINCQRKVWLFKADTLGSTARTITSVEEKILPSDSSGQYWASSGGTITNAYPEGKRLHCTINNKSAADYANLQIVGVKGEVIMSLSRELYSGINTAELDISRIASGVYYLVVQTQNWQTSRQIVITR